VRLRAISLRPGTRHYGDMSVATESRVGWGVAGLSAGVVGFWLVGGGLRDARLGFTAFVADAYPNIVFGLAFPVVGAMILSRLPRHRLGTLYLLCGLASSITLASYSYARQGLGGHAVSLPGAVVAGWVSSWVWLCGPVPLVTLGVLWFPDGRMPSRRWWPVAAAASLFVVIGVFSIAVRPGPLENHPTSDNPFGLPLPRGWFNLVDTTPLQTVLVGAVAGSLAALVVRYRRGSSEVRDQLRWFLVAFTLLIASLALGENARAGVLRSLPTLVMLPLFPVTVGVAVLRGRLYGVDLAVRRSLIYGWLLAIGLVVYAAVVVVMDTILRGHATPAVTLLAAGTVAVLYQPIRLRLQLSADRMLYGERGDPYTVLARLGRRLEQAGTAGQTLPEAVDTIAAALRLPFVAVEVTGDRPHFPTAAHGTAAPQQPLRVPLIHAGETLGHLVVGRRNEREDFTPAERRLLDDLGRQVAVAVHAVLLERALRRSRERVIVARDDERLRLRRDLHDGLGPALAGIALGVDAARNMMGNDPSAADTLLGTLKEETLGCVGEVRRIIDDLRPLALEDLGLRAAIVAFVDRLSSREESLSISLEIPDPFPPLPDAVENAAYRIAIEALTNVTRHAQARSCLVRLDAEADLMVEICDDGIGLPTGRLSGVGLESMRHRATTLGGRCLFNTLETGGTRVLVQLPLAAS
jgi:two-component system, NarL family, sensor kinase